MCGMAVQDGNSAKAPEVPPLFSTSDQCMACHNGLTTPAGADVSIGSDWRASMMANSARDPYWQAAVRRETLDHPAAQPEIENECATCHIPMPVTQNRAAGLKSGVFSNLAAAQAAAPAGLLAADGVSCTACHQITEKGLGTKESFTGGFVVDLQPNIGRRKIFGPFEIDKGRTTAMQSSSGFVPGAASHIANSELCATCHTLYTHALDQSGKIVGELPEQVPYLEWRHSGYGKTRSCQSCHMPKHENMPITSVLGQPRERLSQHVFRAGNFFMPQVFVRYPGNLGMQALSKELNIATLQTFEHLKTSAARLTIPNVQILAGKISAEVVIRNLAGHKLPTAYPSRRAWIHFTVRDGNGETIFESGPFRSDGSISGNDSDSDASRYEPHYSEISAPEQVQVYEAIMADDGGRVTTGLLKGVRYLKDNRILPMGFDKAKADSDIATQGNARDDSDFAAGGDRIHYSVNVGRATGPYTVQAELWYQPIGYRWAQNLRQQKAVETDRFVSIFESMANASAVVLAQVSAAVQ